MWDGGRASQRWRGTGARGLHAALMVGLLLAVGCGDDAVTPPGERVPTRPISDIIDNPILFVTQVPVPADFATIGSTFGNHQPGTGEAGRGGDLYIVYSDGSLRNLTREAGFGEAAALQTDRSIAVREPQVHWDGDKAIFSMVVGAPTELYGASDANWQLYEVTGLGQGQTAVITKLANQPEGYNNLSPIYTSDDKVLFTSDRPRGGHAHHYPQRDEYESTPTNTGLWRLDPDSADPGGAGLVLLDHAPSGDFSPFIDSFGRVVFTRWDHLQRDQQADADYDGANFGTFNYVSEAVGAEQLDSREETFPEPRADRQDLLAGTSYLGHRFNHFLPWMMNQDGTDLETLNHIGRHELHHFFTPSRSDENMIDHTLSTTANTANKTPILNMMQLSEDPTSPGRYLGVDAPEFGTHSGGQIVALNGQPGLHADAMVVTYLTDRATSSPTEPGASAPSGHSGFYRNPVTLSNGNVLSSHASTTVYEQKGSSATQWQSAYDYRIAALKSADGSYTVDTVMTAGVERTVQFYTGAGLVEYSGSLWELYPVEVTPRARPPMPTIQLPAIEESVFSEVGVSVADMHSYLIANDLALLVSRDVTSRDDNDRQQPYNLQIANGGTVSDTGDGPLYQVSYMQFFQANLVRGIKFGSDTPAAGRRPLAQPMSGVDNPLAAGPAGGVSLGADGSMAVFVPAGRALSWQLTDANSEGIVLERNWLTFQPGEIRVCAACHGVNETSQTGAGLPENSPAALRTLLESFAP